MPEHRYDVFELDEPAFEIVSDEEMARLRDISDPVNPGNPGDTGCDDKAVGVEIAHGVSAATAAELVGLNRVPKGVEGFTDPVVWLESHVAEYGSLGITNFSPGAGFQELEVRLNCDDRGT